MTTRTSQQNKALHLYLSQVAEALDREGHSFQNVVSSLRNAEIRPTPENIKQIWREFQKAMYDKHSTTELEKLEVDRVYEVFNAWLGREFQIHVPFPSEERTPEELINWKPPVL